MFIELALCIIKFTFNTINDLKVVNVSILLWFIQIKEKRLELIYNNCIN